MDLHSAVYLNSDVFIVLTKVLTPLYDSRFTFKPSLPADLLSSYLKYYLNQFDYIQNLSLFSRKFIATFASTFV